MIHDSTRRFTERVSDYVKYRPTYPRELVTFVHAECGVAPGAPALRALFEKTRQDGRVNFAYETRVYAGRPQR